MYLIYDIDFVGSLIGFETSFIDKVPDIIDSGITRCIDLDDIKHPIFIICPTVFACMTGIPVIKVRTVHCFCEYSRTRSLSSTTRSMKEVGMTYSTKLEGISENSGSMFLSDN
jgi:hypothetical protein